MTATAAPPPETCFIKFGAVRDTKSAGADYERLLNACCTPLHRHARVKPEHDGF